MKPTPREEGYAWAASWFGGDAPNPYETGTAAHEQWQLGFDRARREFHRQERRRHLIKDYFR